MSIEQSFTDNPIQELLIEDLAAKIQHVSVEWIKNMPAEEEWTLNEWWNKLTISEKKCVLALVRGQLP